MVDDLRITFMGFRGDSLAVGRQPSRKPCADCHPGRVNVLPGIERAQEPAKLFLSVLMGAAHRRRGDPALSGRHVSAHAVAKLEATRRALPDVTCPTH